MIGGVCTLMAQHLYLQPAFTVGGSLRSLESCGETTQNWIIIKDRPLHHRAKTSPWDFLLKYSEKWTQDKMERRTSRLISARSSTAKPTPEGPLLTNETSHCLLGHQVDYNLSVFPSTGDQVKFHEIIWFWFMRFWINNNNSICSEIKKRLNFVNK